MEHSIKGIFPSPIYVTKRDSIINSIEKKEIEDIIKEGMNKSGSNFVSNNFYIFNTKLNNLKEFCEKHIKIYVKEIINPKEELDFYITQSWLNMTQPGGSHFRHSHQNSIISGVFYVLSEENDGIQFYDTNTNTKERIKLETIENNAWNSNCWFLNVENYTLTLFPSWLEHSVEPNKNATTDRISLAFNVFA